MLMMLVQMVMLVNCDSGGGVFVKGGLSLGMLLILLTLGLL